MARMARKMIAKRRTTSVIPRIIGLTRTSHFHHPSVLAVVRPSFSPLSTATSNVEWVDWYTLCDVLSSVMVVGCNSRSRCHCVSSQPSNSKIRHLVHVASFVPRGERCDRTGR